MEKEKQVHLEFQRLKEELDKIASYSQMMHLAEENVQKTTQLINEVGEKYESLVDLIWHEFNAELESLSILKESIQMELAQLHSNPDNPILASLDVDTKTGLVQDVLGAVTLRFEDLDEKLKSQYQTIETYVGQLGDEHKQLEERLQEKIDGQLGALSGKIHEIGEEIQEGLLKAMGDMSQKTAHTVGFPDFKDHPLNNGIGEDLKSQIQQLKEQIDNSDSQLENMIRGSLETTFSSFLIENQSILNSPSIGVGDKGRSKSGADLSQYMSLFQQKLDYSESALVTLLERINGSDDLGNSILERLSRSDDVLRDLKDAHRESEVSLIQMLNKLQNSVEGIGRYSPKREDSGDLRRIMNNLQDRLNGQIDSKFSQVDHKLSDTQESISNTLDDKLKLTQDQFSDAIDNKLQETQEQLSSAINSKLKETREELSQTVSGINQTVQSALKDFSTQSSDLSKSLASLEENSKRGGIETLKKVSRNQLQKLLDNETDLRKQRQLLGIVTVISILNFLLILLVIFSLYQ